MLEISTLVVNILNLILIICILLERCHKRVEPKNNLTLKYNDSELIEIKAKLDHLTKELK